MYRRRFLVTGVAGVTLTAGCVEQARRVQRAVEDERDNGGEGHDEKNDAEKRDDEAPSVQTVVDFEPASLPENLAVAENGDVYLSFRQTDGDAAGLRRLPAAKTEETGLTIEATEAVATLPAGGAGVVLDPDEEHLYVNVNGEDVTGIYRVPVEGGDPRAVVSREDFAELDEFPSENAFLTDLLVEEDRILVNETFGGTTFEVSLEDSSVSVWLDDPLLDAAGDEFAANGIAVLDGDLLIANTSKGLVARVPVGEDGSAGTPEVFVEDESLVGADGIALRGPQLYVAVNGQNAIRRVTPSGQIRTVVEGGVLDFPADVVLGRADQHGDLFVANFAIPSPDDGGGPRLLRVHP